jgi:hypothetical protein
VIVTITVTQDDIDAGVRCQGDACPVWRAVARALPWPVVWVGPEGVCNYRPARPDGFWDWDWGYEYQALLPEEAITWIASYDCGYEAGPFSFGLDVPAELLAGSPA